MAWTLGPFWQQHPFLLCMGAGIAVALMLFGTVLPLVSWQARRNARRGK